VTAPLIRDLLPALVAVAQEERMSLSSHLDELRKKHAALSEIIEEEQRKPSSDDLNIKQLKVRKLHLKEEIERLAAQA
jgi:hypothetical protein